MPARDRWSTVRTERIAVVAPTTGLRDVLVQISDAGNVELDDVGTGREVQGNAGVGRAAELTKRARSAVVRDDIAALGGWAPAAAVPPLAARLAEVHGAVVRLPKPRGVDAPTLLRGTSLRRSLVPLVETYGTVPYADLDPTLLAAASYALMFGMMFGDVGHGLLVLALALALRAGRPRRLARFRRGWPLVAAAGLTSTLFGFLYGECFGPTGLVPVLWLAPLDEPIPLLLAALGLGALLLAGAYAIGTINRRREGGWPLATFAPSGIAGTALFGGVASIAGGWYAGTSWLILLGGMTALVGLALAFAGFLAEAGGGGAGLAQAAIELFDTIVRLGSNIVSFARLAAFGLTHAALGAIIWQGTSGLWSTGGVVAIVGAVVLFAVGNALAFGLEALVASIQALRLEYYELFSRVFQGQGRPFRPWRLPAEEAGDPA
jgi:V/A-type H+/Na+-transporting ATPase subunit I